MNSRRISVALAPVRVDDADNVEWSREADVIVVGFGGAGACAALEAHESGAEVLVIDRFDGGGATAYSGGILYAGGTSVQKRLGITDDAAAMRAYLEAELRGAVAPTTLSRFCEGSRGDVDWLMRLGMPYGGDLSEAPTAYPPPPTSLYYAGNERLFQRKTGVVAAPRGHRPLGPGFTGYVFFDVLRKAVERARIPCLLHTLVSRLITDATGAVIGVEAASVAPTAIDRHRALYASVTPHKPLNPAAQDRAIDECRKLEIDEMQAPVRIRARRGVVIAAGGYVFNAEKLRETQPLLGANHRALVRLGSIGDDGSGIDLGQSVGGAVTSTENVFLSRSIAPPRGLLGGVAVNIRGERFVNEDAGAGDLGTAIAGQPEGRAWLILNRALFIRSLYQCATAKRSQFKLQYAPALLNILRGGTRYSTTIRGLARKIGIPPDALATTIAANNGATASRDDPLGKNAEHLHVMDGGPYVAINLAVTNRLSFPKIFTLGGLQVDEATGSVVDSSGQKIPGLYAAGHSAAGLCAAGYVNGMSLADCVFSGRRAGRAACIQELQHHQTTETAVQKRMR
ncbi:MULTISPECIES: FAD-binding protein [unclassified Caballeronia]|uniref:FAD-binding protein n=1 Tax=unclassified Caballeronia TaxID=2646786 RepID=UPI002856E558|nr:MULTISPECIES: FAD-binding protein [unclassified Caballeronia]MDR5777150.1 FAD-binding protein [Caballeronia sp. LZ002]MDR5852625.1 FAD-binding protein [Caballeronia sp. LZ003]